MLRLRECHRLPKAMLQHLQALACRLPQGATAVCRQTRRVNTLRPAVTAAQKTNTAAQDRVEGVTTAFCATTPTAPD